MNEVEIVQNPSLGAYAMWQFGLGHQEEDGSSAPFILAFLVLPLLLHQPTLDAVTATRKSSGLSLFTARISEKRENILAIQRRAIVLRKLTLQSLGMAATTRLIQIRYDQALIRAYELEPQVSRPFIPERIRAFVNAPAKLGYWFYKSGLDQVVASLKVEF